MSFPVFGAKPTIHRHGDRDRDADALEHQCSPSWSVFCVDE
jgi:hypothetical protein